MTNGTPKYVGEKICTYIYMCVLMMKNPLNLCFTGEGLNELKLIQKILRVAEWMCEFEN